MATKTGMNKKEMTALKMVVEYLWENEEEHYNEMLENGCVTWEGISSVSEESAPPFERICSIQVIFRSRHYVTHLRSSMRCGDRQKRKIDSGPNLMWTNRIMVRH